MTTAQVRGTKLAELERKHEALENELSDAIAHPSVDDITLADLKRYAVDLS